AEMPTDVHALVAMVAAHTDDRDHAGPRTGGGRRAPRLRQFAHGRPRRECLRRYRSTARPKLGGFHARRLAVALSPDAGLLEQPTSGTDAPRYQLPRVLQVTLDARDPAPHRAAASPARRRLQRRDAGARYRSGESVGRPAESQHSER